MTDKKEQLMTTALELFAREGYELVSTKKIARRAGLSEGLIFRHFNNKKGLLEAILESGKDQAWTYYRPILEEQNPREVLRKLIGLPFLIAEQQRHFWQLLYALQWRSDFDDVPLGQTLQAKIRETFLELGYLDPSSETEALLALLDGLFHALLLRESANPEALRLAIHAKYLL